MLYLLTFSVNVTNITVYYTDKFNGSGKDYMSPVTAGITSMAVSVLRYGNQALSLSSSRIILTQTGPLPI